MEKKHKIIAGPLDLLIILFLAETKRFHICQVGYSPFPGQRSTPYQDLSVIRYRSRSHYTDGFVTIQGAQKNIAELRRNEIDFSDGNVFTDTAICAQRPDFTITVTNWKIRGMQDDHPLGDLSPQITSADQVEVIRVSKK